MTYTIATSEGKEPALDPVVATVPGFEGFELFTHKVGRDFCLSEATTGRAIPNAKGECGNYLTRGLAVGAGASWLRRVGPEGFSAMIAMLKAKEEINHAV